MALDQESVEQLIEKLRGFFQSNEAQIQYGEDPQAWVDENLPAGTEPADVASAMPAVCDGLPPTYADHCGRYNASHGADAVAATDSVVNEVSYVTNTIYQQNVFIYAAPGSQVTNIQGDGNTVTQVDIDAQFNTEHPDSYDDYEEPAGDYGDGADDGGDTPAEEPYEEPHDDGGDEPAETPGDEPYETPADEPYEPPVEDPYETPVEEPYDGGDTGGEPPYDGGDTGGNGAPDPMDGMDV